MPENWSECIRQYRARFGITQAELARIMGVSQRTVSRWERGEDQPNPERQLQLRDLGWKPAGLLLRNLSVSVRHCPAPRALSHSRNLRLIEVSDAAIRKRPSIKEWIGHELAPIATGVLQEILDDREIQCALAKRELSGMLTTTRSVLKTPEEDRIGAFHTTISYFYQDGDLYSDAISVPASADAKCCYSPIYMDRDGAGMHA
ncbi:MAG: helix-turn-helix transcriptional regulator [Hyphomicrobiaceae bacterium]